MNDSRETVNRAELYAALSLSVEILVSRIDNYIMHGERYNIRVNNVNNPRCWHNKYKELA